MYYYNFNIGDFRALSDGLDDESVGILLRLMNRYASTENPIKTEWVFVAFQEKTQEKALAILNALWKKTEEGFVLPSLSAVIADYQAMQVKNRQNGKKGGRPKKNLDETEKEPNENPNETQWVSDENPTETENKPIGNPNETLNHKPINHKPINHSKDIDSVEKEEIVHSAEPNALPFSKIVEIYNSVTDGKLPKVAKLTDKRKKAVRNWVKFYKDYTKSKTVAEFLVEVEKYFVLAVDSTFLTGENDRGWKADFDFLMNVNKSVGLLEGKYTSAQKPKEEENPFKITPIHDWYQEREDYLKAQREQEEFIKAKRAEEEKEGLHHEEAIRRYFKECNA